jgi:predicted ABC-type ATPase
MMPKESSTPTVYVIAGPNGAGKTTFASKYLPDFVKCREFLNADLIAAGLSPFSPDTQNVRAGRLLLERIDELASQHIDFGFETTLAGRTYWKRLSDLKASGYRVILLFLWLPTADLAVMRVANRVRQGGHGVPIDDIQRRYSAGIKNLFRLYLPILDGWCLYDASKFPPELIAVERQGSLTVQQASLYQQIRTQAEQSDDKSTEPGMREQVITEDPMSDLANAAFAATAKEVIKRAIETGTPVIVWRNGSVMQLDPHELTQDLAQSGQFRSKFLR